MIIVYRKKIGIFFFICLIQAFTLLLFAQYPANYQYTLLQSEIVDEIIGASSGELALRHIIELAPYTQLRYDEEFSGNFRETDYVLSVLSKYGLNHSLDNVGEIPTWRGLQGTLWEISPRKEKVADFSEVPEMLVEGSQPADLTAELIWVGDGSPVIIEANREKIKGKIIVTSAPPYSVHLRALNAGAVGTISYYSPRPLVDPIQIPNTSIPAKGFAFLMPPREGEILKDRLLRGETIRVSVKIESKTEQAKLQVPWCIIPGTDPSAGEIIFTAHLFEGYTKMGANDNMSGSAVLLEVAHVLNDLIEAEKIDPPVRTIRFLWVPEFDGTIPWVNQNLQKVKKAICDINLDMVGINLRANKSFMCLHKSGFSTAHYVNDVVENYFRYVGETNVEGITDQLGRRGFSRRIVAPTGTNDPFYYRILSLHGSSDNAVFNDWSINIPGVKLITWPDNYYHSSEDNPDKCDPTQLRRIIFISAASAYTMASADEKMAVRILSEMFSSATARLGIQMAKSSDMVNKADAVELPAAYKRACYNLEGTAMAEKSAMDKVIQLSDKPEVVGMIEVIKKEVNNILQIHLSALKELMINRTAQMKIPQINLSPDSIEKKATKIIPSVTDKALNMGYGGEWNYISALSSDFLSKNYYGNIVNTSEAAGLADGKRNLLEIKKMVDAQFEKESPLQDIINYYTVLKEAGLMKY